MEAVEGPKNCFLAPAHTARIHARRARMEFVVGANPPKCGFRAPPGGKFDSPSGRVGGRGVEARCFPPTFWGRLDPWGVLGYSECVLGLTSVQSDLIWSAGVSHPATNQTNPVHILVIAR